MNFSDQAETVGGVNLAATIRDQYGDTDIFSGIGPQNGAHFWGSKFDDHVLIGNVSVLLVGGLGRNDTVTIQGEVPWELWRRRCGRPCELGCYGYSF